MNLTNLPENLRRDLLRYLGASSEERARLIGDLAWRNPAMAELLSDLEVDDDIRVRVELKLLASLNHKEVAHSETEENGQQGA